MSDDATQLTRAAEKGLVDEVKALLARGVPVNAPEGEYSALCLAAMFRRVETVRVLLEAGANPSHRGNTGWTPAHHAAQRSPEILKLLIAAGADVTIRDRTGYDPFDGAVSHDAPLEAFELLLAAGVDPRARHRGTSRLNWACYCGNLEVAKLLVNAGADAFDGLAAVGNGDEAQRRAVVKFLVQAGVAPNRPSGDILRPDTLFNAVIRFGDLDDVRTLLDRGADLNFAVSGLGSHGTPLMAAEVRGDPGLIDLLLERGARVPGREVPPELEALRSATVLAARDADARQRFGHQLLNAGYRAAAARELQVADQLGAVDQLRHAVIIEKPAWRFVFPSPLPVEPVTSIIEDARMPNATVTDGARTLPLVVVLGPECTYCDEKGETECSACSGTGRSPSLFSDDDNPCDPRQQCTLCRGLKFRVGSLRDAKGLCRHPRFDLEGNAGEFELRRCPSCGLARLQRSTFELSACGHCGHFVCVCST